MLVMTPDSMMKDEYVESTEGTTMRDAHHVGEAREIEIRGRSWSRAPGGTKGHLFIRSVCTSVVVCRAVKIKKEPSQNYKCCTRREKFITSTTTTRTQLSRSSREDRNKNYSLLKIKIINRRKKKINDGFSSSLSSSFFFAAIQFVFRQIILIMSSGPMNVTCTWRNVTDEIILDAVFGSSLATEFRMDPRFFTTEDSGGNSTTTALRELEEGGEAGGGTSSSAGGQLASSSSAGPGATTLEEAAPGGGPERKSISGSAGSSGNDITTNAQTKTSSSTSSSSSRAGGALVDGVVPREVVEQNSQEHGGEKMSPLTSGAPGIKSSSSSASTSGALDSTTSFGGSSDSTRPSAGTTTSDNVFKRGSSSSTALPSPTSLQQDYYYPQNKLFRAGDVDINLQGSSNSRIHDVNFNTAGNSYFRQYKRPRIEINEKRAFDWTPFNPPKIVHQATSASSSSSTGATTDSTPASTSGNTPPGVLLTTKGSQLKLPFGVGLNQPKASTSEGATTSSSFWPPSSSSSSPSSATTSSSSTGGVVPGTGAATSSRSSTFSTAPTSTGRFVSEYEKEQSDFFLNNGGTGNSNKFAPAAHNYNKQIEIRPGRYDVEIMKQSDAYQIIKESRADTTFHPQSFWRTIPWKRRKGQMMMSTSKRFEANLLLDDIGGGSSAASTTMKNLQIGGSSSSSSIPAALLQDGHSASNTPTTSTSAAVVEDYSAASLSSLTTTEELDPEQSSTSDRLLQDSSNSTDSGDTFQFPTNVQQPTTTTTTTTTPWPGPSYDSITSHPQYDAEKIYDWLNPRLHEAQNKNEPTLVIQNTDYPLAAFRCYGPNGFVASTSTTTTTTRFSTSSSSGSSSGSVQIGASVASAPRRSLEQLLGIKTTTERTKSSSSSFAENNYNSPWFYNDPDDVQRYSYPEEDSFSYYYADPNNLKHGRYLFGHTAADRASQMPVGESAPPEDPSDGDWSVNATHGYKPHCLRERCLQDVDPNAVSVSQSNMMDCAALNCLQCKTFTNMTCTVCLAYTLGRPEFFCMHNEDVCADLRYARPFTDSVEINGQCPDEELRLIIGDNNLGVVPVNITVNTTAPKDWKNPIVPDIFTPQYLPYIFGGISAPFVVFIVFFIYGRYRKMIERLKTFNADGMANPEVAQGDFTKLKRFFVEFLEDFLEKSKQSWDEEIQDLKEFEHRSEKCRRQLAVFRKTLKFRRENMISAKHLNLIAKYMRVMPYLCLHLHCDWYESDEKTLQALCNVIRLSFSSESLKLYKIKCRVSFEHDTLKFPPSMNAQGRSSVDDIAELLFFNPSVNRLKVMNAMDIRLEKKQREKSAWYRQYYRKYVAPTLDGIVPGASGRRGSRGNYKVSPEDDSESLQLAIENGEAFIDEATGEVVYTDEADAMHHNKKERRNNQKNSLLTIITGENPWDPVDLYKLRQLTTGRVDTKEMNFGLIGSCCYLGALKALRNLRVLRLRDCNLNDGVADTLLKLLKRCKLVQLVLSNNYFGDALMKKMIVYFEDRAHSEDLKLLQVDKNMIRGNGFREWRSDDFEEQITIDELCLGTEFFGNPLLGDKGVTNLVRSLQFEIEQFKLDQVKKPTDEDDAENSFSDESAGNNSPNNAKAKKKFQIKKLMRKVARRNQRGTSQDAKKLEQTQQSSSSEEPQKKKEDDPQPIAKPVKWKFKCLRALRLCHCRLTVKGAKAVANYICHPSALPLKILALDGNAIKDDGLEFLMKGFCQRLKIRQGGAHAATAAQAKKVVSDLDDIDEEEQKRLDEENEDKEFEMAAAAGTSMLDMDITEEYVLHQCERKAVGADPVLEELGLNDCLLTDASLNMLMIFIRTERLDLVRLGGMNPMSTQMRKDIHNHNMEVAKIRNVNRGFITAKVPVMF
ncbi:unnamed protein product [Amoebophrya sp. A120]|nr:unnamed protein product [Amoebophrya sp. A120]|eukprot:GSA120T00004629001.1